MVLSCGIKGRRRESKVGREGAVGVRLIIVAVAAHLAALLVVPLLHQALNILTTPQEMMISQKIQEMQWLMSIIAETAGREVVADRMKRDMVGLVESSE
jgi:predicted tellurium resistance membrane protein TerC